MAYMRWYVEGHTAFVVNVDALESNIAARSEMLHNLAAPAPQRWCWDVLSAGVCCHLWNNLLRRTLLVWSSKKQARSGSWLASWRQTVVPCLRPEFAVTQCCCTILWCSHINSFGWCGVQFANSFVTRSSSGAARDCHLVDVLIA